MLEVACLCNVVRHVVHDMHVKIIGRACEHLGKCLRAALESNERPSLRGHAHVPAGRERSSSFG